MLKISTKRASGLERALRRWQGTGPVLHSERVIEDRAGMNTGWTPALTQADARLTTKNIEADANPASADQEKSK